MEESMARRMADSQFREEQWKGRYDRHVGPINELVNDINALPNLGGSPYVPPMHGGIDARLLCLLRDPGRKAHGVGGSGFICMENDDPTAESICNLCSEAGIDARDMVLWNIYPWYINRAPTSAERAAGIEPLRR